MSIVKSSKGKDRLLFEGFRYRRANKSRVTWRCVLNRCAGRLNFNNNTYVMLTDHSHAPNPDALISIELKSKVSENAVISNDAPRKIIHEVLLSVLEGEEVGGLKVRMRLKCRGSRVGSSTVGWLNCRRLNCRCTIVET